MTTRSIDLGSGRSAWRFFPIGIIGALGVVVVVNFGMIWSALHTFPGAVDDHAFDTGNNYNAILDEASREAALGWRLDAVAEGDRLSIRLTDRQGAPISRANVSATARRPVGPDEATAFALALDGDRFVTPQALPGRGQWDVQIVATEGDHTLHLTRRVLVR